MAKRDEVEEKLAALEWNSLAAEEPPAHNPQAIHSKAALRRKQQQLNQLVWLICLRCVGLPRRSSALVLRLFNHSFSAQLIHFINEIDSAPQSTLKE